MSFSLVKDEATADPDGCAWDAEENASELAGDDVLNETIQEFVAEDWAEGQSAALTYGVAADEDAQKQDHGAQNHGDGGLASAALETMDEDDVDILVEGSNKLRTPHEASRLFKGMGSALGDSLQNTVSSVIQIETKRLAANQKVDTTVVKELMQDFQAEEATFRIQRIQHQEQMTLRREKTAATLALKEADASPKKARKDQKRVEKATAAMASAKAFTLTQLRQGKKNGGIQANQKHRAEVLDRVREVAGLSPEQTCHWSFFKRAWDETMAETHGVNWGGLFAQIVQ